VRRQREELHERLAQATTAEERLAVHAEIEADPVATEPEVGLGKARLPFGPFLVLALLEYLLFGSTLVEAYIAGIWP
jgi:leader peptidase (prepilin peptidase)/N-methyltransferase